MRYLFGLCSLMLLLILINQPASIIGEQSTNKIATKTYDYFMETQSEWTRNISDLNFSAPIEQQNSNATSQIYFTQDHIKEITSEGNNAILKENYTANRRSTSQPPQIYPNLILNIYSAIVYIDRINIFAINRSGKIIANGIAGKDDASVIQAAIDYVAPNYGSVYVASGIYSHSAKVNIKFGVSLIYEHGARVIPASDIDLFQLHPYTQLSGVTIDTTGIIYTHNCILLDGFDRFSLQNYKSTRIRDIELEGNAGIGTGTAIYFSSQNNTSGYICGVIIENTRIDQFEYGIKLYRTGHYGDNFINGNTFRSIQGYNTVYFITMLNSGTPESDLDGNAFRDINYQSGSNSVTAIKIGGRYNRIDATIWDWTVAGKAIVIQDGANENYIISNVDVENDGNPTNKIVEY